MADPENSAANASNEDTSAVDRLLETSLRDIGIPPRPAILDRIASEMRKDDPDFKRLAAIISADVSLAAGLIKTANSPFFGTGHRARNVGEALTLLGLKVAGRAIAGIILHKVFPNAPQLVRFWDASARVAQLSGWLTQQIDGLPIHADDVYIFGLFRDCGIPVLLRRYPEYSQVLANANNEAERSFTTIEDTKYPANHAQVGCLLAQSWWLPDDTGRAIRHHHDLGFLTNPSPKSAGVRSQIAVAQLAEFLIQQHSGLNQTNEWSKLGPACLTILGLTAEDLPRLVAEAAPVIESEV